MLFVHGLILGGLSIYAGTKARQAKNKKAALLTHTTHTNTIPDASDDAKDIVNPTKEKSVIIVERKGDKDFPIATASLGCVVAGATVFPPLTLLGVGGLIYLLVPTWKQGYRDIVQKKRFTRMVLESIALPATLLSGHYVGAAVAYWFLYYALDTIAKAKGSATKNLASIFVAPSSQVVYVIRDEVELEMSLKDLQLGDILVVGAGEIIPVDGTIIEGHASIDQHMLTGESQHVEKQVGDHVMAATMLLNGHIHLQVEKTGEDTIASQTSQILNGMTSFTESLELRSIDTADRMALPYFLAGTATSIFKGPAGGLALVWSPLDDAMYSTGPLGVLNYLNIALKRGILIKDGRALEVLRKVDTIVFDKTGTLTNEVPEVVKIHVCGKLNETEILRYAASAEHKQIHPVALAILEAASQRNIELTDAQGEAYRTGYGLTVSIEEHTVLIGSLRFMEQQSLSLPESLENTQQASCDLGYSLIYIAIDNAIAGAIELHARVRPDTVETIDKLHDRGFKVCIISGDHEKPTRHLAAQLGIDEYFAETLPEDKAKLIESMQKNGQTVCYMGDGINDTIALKQAEVSVSLRGASTIATDTAQVVLMNEQLIQLIDLIDIAKDLDNTYKKIIVSSAIPSIGIIGGIFFFHFTLSAAIAGYIAGMGMSVTHAMTPLTKEWFRSKKENKQRALPKSTKKNAKEHDNTNA